MVALVDCNNFFCSVERVFHPGLGKKPVCVLSSNDGCIIALSQEAKALGLKRGDPFFQVSDIVEKNNIKIFSTNMPLYAAMSRRITNILRQEVARVENYSIDESFCYLDGYELHYDLSTYMRRVAEKIKLYTDIPVSVGIAPTKTLAKVGNKFAKKYSGYRSVCMIDSDAKRRKALSMFDLADIWGIGRQTLAKLQFYGVKTSLEFADKSEGWVRNRFNKPVVQTWRELNGTPCIDTAEALLQQSICTSRSFGNMITDLNALKASVATFASACANTLRGQRSLAGSITVFVKSNRHRQDLAQYANSQTHYFPIPTADTLEITKRACRMVEQLYREGIAYKKSGVILGNIVSAAVQQQQLFDHIPNRAQRGELMRAIDRINQCYGHRSIHLAIERVSDTSWHNKHQYRSLNYLTNLDEILTIQI